MRFWTSFQYPLHQAALVDNGKVVRTIPDHAPKTPARMVGPIGRWDDDHILVGRRSSVELWTADGRDLVQQVNHPWIYGFHVVKRYQDYVLCGSAGPDCVFLLDWDGNVHGSWFAYKQGLSADIKGYPIPFGEGTEWLAFQLTQNFKLKNSAHLNSANIAPDGEIFVTLCHRRKIVRVDPDTWQGKVVDTTGDLPHDFQYDWRFSPGRKLVGLRKGLQTEGRWIFPEDTYTCVKRITQAGDNLLAFTHETGAVLTGYNAKVLESVDLPRPWHVVNLEM